MIGATSGIGAAMADRLIKKGSKVIAVGRRQDKLDDFVHKHGEAKASAVRYDISDRKNMDGFIDNITHHHPNLDCVFLNAGVQTPTELANPAKFNAEAFHSEFAVNFNSMVDLSMKFLPFLQQKKDTSTSLIFTGSNLAIVPASGLSAYSASKAALNAFVLCLRLQLEDSSVKIIEISPPPVQTELHDYMGEDKGRALGMPLETFTDEAYKGLEAGKDQIVIGSIGPPEVFHDIVDKRRGAAESLHAMMKRGMGR
ncbi:MAG: hypothetical protein Q9184_006954 [Pyrenodesmia sp. 2 TL-2023]